MTPIDVAHVIGNPVKILGDEKTLVAWIYGYTYHSIGPFHRNENGMITTHYYRFEPTFKVVFQNGEVVETDIMLYEKK